MWFFGGKPAVLILRPDPSGCSLHGFQSGKPLHITSDFFGQRVGDLLEKFNTYRGPDQQILHIWDPVSGEEISHSFSLKSDTVAIIRSTSTI